MDGNEKVKLDFRFMQGDAILEARTKLGYYHVYEFKDGFRVSGYVNKETFVADDYPNIYEALDAANDHYRKHQSG